MRWLVLVFLMIGVGCGPGPGSRTATPDEPDGGAPQPGSEPARTKLHTEQGLKGPIEVEEDIDYQRPLFKDDNGRWTPSGEIRYHKLLYNGVLWGSQARHWDRNVFDMFQALSAMHPWDNLLFAGADHGFDMRQEPLTYYHRTGPVGAIFKELRTRKNGADAKAPVAKLGLETGAVCCYLLTGQKITIYEADPALKRLVADTDKYFSYVGDARKRGADIEIRVGDRRAKLSQDKGRKYDLLLVDPAELYPRPFSLLTKEAVRLYFDRLTDDGIVAIDISSRDYKFELVLARVAAELGLAARVWYDEHDRRGPGKTLSSWVVLARKPEHLGSLNAPASDLLFGRPGKPGADDLMRCSPDSTLEAGLTREYPDDLRDEEGGKTKREELNATTNPRAAWLGWVRQKWVVVTDPWERKRLDLYAELIAAYGPDRKFSEVILAQHGHFFRRLPTVAAVPLWTDGDTEVVPAVKVR